MRTLYAFVMATLDGFFEGPDQELDWHHADEEFDEFAAGQLNDTDVLLFGRVTYEGMAGFWPTPAAQEEAPGVTERMNGLPKVVFSTTLETAEWSNTRLVREHVAEEVRVLKEQPGGSIGVLGSPTLTAGLIRMGLLDELRVMVNPVALGAGRSLLGGLDRALELELLQTRTFRSGNVLLTYRPLAR